MKQFLSKISLYLILILGLSLLLYPSCSDYWNSFHSSKAISNFTQVVSEMDEEEYARILKKGGVLITAGAGENHLIGLKRAIYDTTYKNKNGP